MKRRRLSDRDPGNMVFGTIGWLFADLMFALAIAFLVATTVGQPTPGAGIDGVHHTCRIRDNRAFCPGHSRTRTGTQAAQAHGAG